MARLPLPTELEEHRNLVAYLRIRGLRFTHVANETGTRSKWIGVRNKQNGVSPGFPDFLIIIGNRLIALELKRQQRSITSKEQIAWIAALNDCSVVARVCKGYVESVKFIEEMERT